MQKWLKKIGFRSWNNSLATWVDKTKWSLACLPVVKRLNLNFFIKSFSKCPYRAMFRLYILQCCTKWNWNYLRKFNYYFTALHMCWRVMSNKNLKFHKQNIFHLMILSMHSSIHIFLKNSKLPILRFDGISLQKQINVCPWKIHEQQIFWKFLFLLKTSPKVMDG